MGIKVVLNLEIYKTIIASTVRYANSNIPEEEWSEVYGLLYGYADGDSAVITAAVPFTHTKQVRRILKVEFSEQDYVDAAEIETQMMVRDPPQYIMGWYHSHPGIRVMLSQDDIRTQLSWQESNPKAVALVFNPKRLSDQVEMPSKKGAPKKQLTNDPGFKIYQLNDPKKGIQAQYHEVEYEFSDFAVDGNLIRNAQEFLGYVTKAFPRGEEFLTKAQRFVEQQKTQIDQLIEGARSYLDTLKRQNKEDRIPNVLELQRNELEKVLEFGNARTSLYQMLIPYVEFKERESLIPPMKDLLKEWKTVSEAAVNRLEALF